MSNCAAMRCNQPSRSSLFCWLALSAFGCGSSHQTGSSQDAGVVDHHVDHHDAGDDSGIYIDAGQAPHDAGRVGDCGKNTVTSPVLIVYDLHIADVLGSDVGDVSASLSGVASELGHGNVPSELKSIAATHGIDASDASDATWLRLTADSGDQWLIVATHTSDNFAVAKGAHVDATYTHHFGGFDPTRDALELRVGEKLAFFYATDAAPSSIAAPVGVTISRGSELCLTHGECGDYALYDLDVTVDGMNTTLGTSQSTTVGEYEVTHERTAAQTGGNTSCADWFVADTTLTIQHRTELATPPMSCKVTKTSTLPGVHIEIDHDACTFTLAEAKQGLRFKYQVVIDSDVTQVTPMHDGFDNCAPLQDSQLYVNEKISGGEQSYCVCDQGLCAPEPTPGPFTLKQGSYESTFDWDGHNWSGPSDTGVPKGPPFPAGEYSFEVNAAGSTPAGAFEVKSVLTFTLQ